MGCRQSKGGGPSEAVLSDTHGKARFQYAGSEIVTSVAGWPGTSAIVTGVDGDISEYDYISGQLRHSWTGHTRAVTRCVSVQMLGSQRLLSSSADASVKMWGNDTEAMAVFRGHEMSVNSVDWSADASCVVSGSRDCTVRLWDTETAKDVGKAKVLRNVVTSLRVVPARNTVVQCSEDLRLRLWSTESRSLREVATVGSGPNQLICCEVSPDGNYVLAGSKGFSRENCQLHLFDLRQLKEVISQPCFNQSVEGVAWLSDSVVLGVAKDCCVRTFAAQTLQPLSDFGPEASPFSCCCVLGDGCVMVAGGGPQLSVLKYKSGGLGQPTVVACV